MRLKTSKSKTSSAVSFTYAYELQSSIPAEQLISPNDLKKLKNTPTYSTKCVNKLPAEALFASRTLRKGQMLTNGDIYYAQTVAVAMSHSRRLFDF